jgi:hypothetical protein
MRSVHEQTKQTSVVLPSHQTFLFGAEQETNFDTQTMKSRCVAESTVLTGTSWVSLHPLAEECSETHLPHIRHFLAQHSALRRDY